MGTRAQQALERKPPAVQAGSATARNVAGTREANARALQRSALPRFNRRANYTPEKSPGWQGSTGIDNGYGGMGYGPTSAMQKAANRADPQQMAREALTAGQSPNVHTVNAPGSIWTDPTYGSIANSKGAEYATRLRDINQRMNTAKEYSALRSENLQRGLQENQAKRADTLDQMKYQQAIATYGTPEQLQQAFGQGAYRAPDGSIVIPGAAGTKQVMGTETGQPATMAVDQNGAFTGQPASAQTQLNPAQVQPTASEAGAGQDAHEEKLAKIKALVSELTAFSHNQFPDKGTTNQIQAIQDTLDGLISGHSSPPQSSGKPDSASEVMKRLKAANPNADTESPEFQKLYQQSLRRFGLNG